jgi:hypothetical protein
MLFALVSSAYAPAQRASGIGLATGFGRVGAFSTTLLGGALLSLPSGRVQAVLGADLMAIAAVVVGLVIVDRHTPPRSGRDARRKDSAAMLATSAAVAET